MFSQSRLILSKDEAVANSKRVTGAFSPSTLSIGEFPISQPRIPLIKSAIKEKFSGFKDQSNSLEECNDKYTVHYRNETGKLETREPGERAMVPLLRNTTLSIIL